MDAETEVHPRAALFAREADARFTPGTMVAGRYRIVALLGEGGMGEVYRADDVKLGQRVALKYIPPRIADDAAAIERFYSEVRIGRQVTHPNVCRVHDLVETGGQRFIAMEYVDGEDLASLLLRIGRLPADKALHLARDLCAGLGAAHERGFIHRDLKPANIMIDGRGDARITDFGLAVLAREAAGEIVGTIAYMAPEQLSGGTATARSDVYALGLVLYEMFTGRIVFDGESIDAVREQHDRPKAAPASIVRDLDPAVERLILRCIDEDPGRRPATAHEVLAALPGGDPLDAAVAAGETPSPEMVAAAMTVGDLTAGRAWAYLGLLVAFLAAVIFIRDRALLIGFAPDVESPATLTDRARRVKQVFGYADPVGDTNVFFVRDYALLQGALARDGLTALPAAADWMRKFHYRDSPRALIPRNGEGRVTADDPPFTVAGMTDVTLDGRGRLRELRHLPPERVARGTGAVDWSHAFREAELDPAHFRPVTPSAVPPVGADMRYAWRGGGLHVEAASAGGHAVWFYVEPPWPRASDAIIQPRGTVAGTAVVFIVAILAGVTLGRRNILRGRADLRGARRLAGVAGLIQLGAFLCGADHVAVFAEEWRMVAGFLGSSLYFASVIWLCHVTIEPYVRRRWPHMLVSVKRLFDGRVRDPLVGADILRGLIAAAAANAAWSAAEAILIRRGLYVPLEQVGNTFTLRTLGLPLLVFDCVARGMIVTFLALMVIVLARLIVRRDTAAWIVLWIVLSIAADDLAGTFAVDTLLRAILFLPMLIVARRYGALTLATAFAATFFLVYTPMTFDVSRWYGRFNAAVLLFIGAVGIYTFRTAVAGKPLFGRWFVEDDALA